MMNESQKDIVSYSEDEEEQKKKIEIEKKKTHITSSNRFLKISIITYI